VLGLCVATASCLPTADFHCHVHTDCGAGAFCEVDGRCSAVDPKCPTGRRYLAHEGGSSNRCVGDSCAANPLLAVAAGLEHACALREDRTVSCWGRNDDGQLGDGTRTPRSLDVAVPGVTGAISVAAGQRHNCAATGAGAVLCWGADEAGQLGDGGGPSRATPEPVAGITTAIAVTAGDAFSCAILGDRTAVCWGDNSLGQLGDGGDAKSGRPPTPVFALTGIRALSAEWQHACALRDDETLWCWGDNTDGQLGDGSIVDRPLPVEVQTLGSVTRVATGLRHTCAATRASGLFCWGANDAGQLGNEGIGGQTLPTAVRLVPDPIAVAAGAGHTCAIRKSGETLCWGANADGQLGEGSTSALPIPAAVTPLGAVADVVAGGSFSCALDAHGALFCWGDDHFGQLGIGRAVFRAQPAPVPSVSDAVDVASGAGHTCVVAGASGAPKTVLCWGANQAGQLGDATVVDHSSATPVKGGFDAATVAAGMAHTCAIADGGALFCWGRGLAGQLGLGPSRMIDMVTPAEVPLVRPALSVAAGDAHTCVALDSGTAECWGANADGQLGDGTTTDHSKPAPVFAVAGTPLEAIDAIVAGAGHTCAHLSDGGLRCWGRGDDGQLGDDASTMRALPVAISLGPPPGTAISAGAAHTCALDAVGGVWCWGRGDDGQLGAGDAVGAPAPVAVLNVAAGARGVAAGGAHTCAIAEDETVRCWGANDDGQLGADGPSSSMPAPVPGLTKVVQLGAGATHTCARRDDGSIWCWGGNTAGQLGDGDALSQLRPQLARLACH
jgi:alpha-tubulin suppressor-like RCC1 family protein